MAEIPAATIAAVKLRGFSLVEVLVALFLQAFGMLGMTALQIKALKVSHAALTDSHAQFLLADMAERVRGNPDAAYAIAFMDDIPAAGKNCEVVVCSSSDLASWDIRQWRTRIEDAAYLPEGEGQITFDNLARAYDIAIRYSWGHVVPAELFGNKRTVSLTTTVME